MRAGFQAAEVRLEGFVLELVLGKAKLCPVNLRVFLRANLSSGVSRYPRSQGDACEAGREPVEHRVKH
jgi:hypothetical protein